VIVLPAKFSVATVREPKSIVAGFALRTAASARRRKRPTW
jgi:hypothetical protein